MVAFLSHRSVFEAHFDEVSDGPAVAVVFKVGEVIGRLYRLLTDAHGLMQTNLQQCKLP